MAQSLLKRFNLILFSVIFYGAFFNPLEAATNCSTSVSPLSALKDSAIEIELGLNEKIVDYITTKSGTMEGLFDSPHAIPPEVIQWIKTHSGSESVLNYNFESLPPDLKLLALQKGIISKKLKFGISAHEGRKIPGLKIKEIYQEKFNLMPYVELGSPSSSRDAKLIEIHMRAAKPPGELALQAAKFQKILGYLPGSIHMHIVFDLPTEWLSQNPIKRSWQLFDFWRRLNLAMEMRDVFENGRALIDNFTEVDGQRYNNFSPARQNVHQHVLAYLISLGYSVLNKKNKVLSLGSASKMAWVGFWSHEKYDKPNLFGFELRFLDGNDLPPDLVQFLNQLPQQVRQKKWGIEENDFFNWGQYIQHLQSKDDLSSGITNLFKGKDFPIVNEGLANQAINPHRDYQEMYQGLTYDFQKILLGMNQQKVQEAFNSRGRLRYLIHDWSLDPLFYDKPQLQTKINNLQLRALRKWARGENEKEVVQDFLLESGIYQVFSNSIGFTL
jgi:hypothetical protein